MIGKLIEINYDYLFWIIFLLILGIAGNIASIVYSISAWKEKRYCYVMNNKVRIREYNFKKDENVPNVKNVPNVELTSRYISAFEKDIVKPEKIIEELKKQGEKADNPPTLADGYLYCIHKNALINAKKAFKVTRSQYIFIASIIIIVLPLVVLLIHLPHTNNMNSHT